MTIFSMGGRVLAWRMQPTLARLGVQRWNVTVETVVPVGNVKQGLGRPETMTPSRRWRDAVGLLWRASDTVGCLIPE